MYHRQEDELDPTDWSETESMAMVPADASLDFLAQKLNTKEIKLTEKGDEALHQYQDSRTRYCGREFNSDKDLGGHLRIHSQHKAKSKAGIHHMKSTKLSRKHSPQEEDDSFACFICDDSFSTMKLLCQHMRNHREMDSNCIQQPIPSQESNSLSEPETAKAEEGIDTISPRNDLHQGSSIDLLKDIPSWSQTGKRGRKRTVSDKIDNIIYHAVPLRVYYGLAVPLTERRLEDSKDINQSLFTRKKQKTEETMSYQDALMESEVGAAADSESTLDLLGNSTEKTSMMPQGFENHVSNKFKSSSSQRRLKNPKRAKAVKSVHQCEICGKIFQTGQALGGHKTYHRVKPVVDPLRVELVKRKAKEELSEESGQVREYITRMLLPGVLSAGEADSSEESYQERPKRFVDFDLNIPYEGQISA
ncbi:uncharacterized protein LOC111284293 [Durio zibethinus]|uniref:Uncharacterized protein LOC111284293 n=1 Tax=Durio zibethinus TaxID=66656 RepID=A0A6P5XLI5_DURZI|nr:uncharacterized protein LOC111284293 [Durio zibethinus]